MNHPSALTPGPDHAAPHYDVVSPDTVEPKTKAATAAGVTSAGIITPAIVLAVDQMFYGGGEVDVPLQYVGLIGLVVTGLCTFAAGYSARHVNRIQPTT